MRNFYFIFWNLYWKSFEINNKYTEMKFILIRMIITSGKLISFNPNFIFNSVLIFRIYIFLYVKLNDFVYRKKNP